MERFGGLTGWNLLIKLCMYLCGFPAFDLLNSYKLE